jgi:hypothetical protein
LTRIGHNRPSTTPCRNTRGTVTSHLRGVRGVAPLEKLTP